MIWCQPVYTIGDKIPAAINGLSMTQTNTVKLLMNGSVLRNIKGNALLSRSHGFTVSDGTGSLNLPSGSTPGTRGGNARAVNGALHDYSTNPPVLVFERCERLVDTGVKNRQRLL